jgi:VWFA-related protein
MKILRSWRVGLLVGVAVVLAGAGVMAQQQGSATQPGQAAPGQSAAAQSGEPKLKGEAEAAQSDQKIAVEVKVVNVLASVRDKKGKTIADLTKDDFVLTEDGKPQAITYFARESDLPLRLGLMVDTSLSQRRVLGEERDASYGFLDHLLRVDKDLAFVIHFDREVELLQEFTASLPKLQAALQLLQTPEGGVGGRRGGGGANGGGANGGGGNGGQGGPGGWGGGGGGGQRGRGGAGTLLYDSIYLAADELMKKEQGRKALIILSDGVDHGSRETLVSAIEDAQKADTIVYSILFKDDEGFSGRPGFGMGGGGMGGGRRGGGQRMPEHVDGKKILEQISRETGGRLFEVSKKEPIDKIYAQIEEELRNQYSIGYPVAKDATPGYHKLSLTAKKKDLIVQARDGYYLEQ